MSGGKSYKQSRGIDVGRSRKGSKGRSRGRFFYEPGLAKGDKMAHAAHIEVIDIQGYMSFVLYIHYFTPGSLKIRSLVVVSEGKYFDYTTYEYNTRRWLQEAESPYPGYCRAPGSAECLPLFCDCKKLIEIWTKIQETQEKLARLPERT